MSEPPASASGTPNPPAKIFLCGVCEGFYGKPWTTEERCELFRRMQRMNMQTYMYAPKDDYKHRLYWRSLYSDEEAEELQELISAAKEHGVTFVYALSPGLDITYSSKADKDLLKKKLNQVRSFGCESFALLFDDIEPDMVDEDDEMFESVAKAQAIITNEVYKALGKPDVFLFCPTEYCTTRTVPDLIKSDYLKVLGKALDKHIDILWTGPKVVSRKITITGIKEVSSLIQRPPVIWDNIHANDYDQTRLFLGPYDGRAVELRQVLRGVLTNPNCEFEANFIAMHTLAQWSKNRTECYPPIKASKKTSTDGDMDTDCVSHYSVPRYSPKRALQCAVEDWLPELYRKKSESGRSRRRRDNRDGRNVSSMETDSSPQRTKSKEKKSTKKLSADMVMKKKMEELEPLVVEELMLICDLFYLPYEHGSRALGLLKNAHWLISNVSRVANMQKIPKEELSPEVREWYDKAIHFHERHKEVCLVVDKLVNITNRDLLYQLYTYMSDMRSCLSLVNSYIKWHGMGKPDKEPFRRGEQEPWVHRSGLYGEFRRLLPLEGQNDTYPPPGKLTSGNKVFTIRPYSSDDKEDLYAVCRQCCDDNNIGGDLFSHHPDIVAEECIGCLLEHFPTFCYVMEDDAGLCGYAAATPNVTEYHKRLTDDWYPAMRNKYPEREKEEKEQLTPAERDLIEMFRHMPNAIPRPVLPAYPGYIQISVIPARVEGLNTPSRLLGACLQTLKAHKVCGIHTTIQQRHIHTLTFLDKLGFEEITGLDEGDNQDVVIREMLLLGRQI